MTATADGWQDTKPIDLDGLTVTLSEPVLVRRTRWFSWFPSLFKLPGGDLLASMSATADAHVSASVVHLSRSRDGGLTWEEPKTIVDGGYASIDLPSGDTLLLPYYLRPRPGGMGGPCNLVQADGSVKYEPSGVEVTGWPRQDRSHAPELGTCGFVFNGQPERLRDGKWLMTLYGYFEGEERLSLVCVDSGDGIHWEFRSIIVGADCALEGGDGPSESALCRLPDGRLMCVFRMSSFVPFGQVWSVDDGVTWTQPVAMAGPFSVEPGIAALPDGTIALSGGRPGVYVWFDPEGKGETWRQVDIVAHHNACRESDLLSRNKWGDEGTVNTSSYTEIIALDDRHLLLIYDRLANGWSQIPDAMDDTNSVWVVRVGID